MMSRKITLVFLAATLIFAVSSCGKKVANNKYLGSLPGLSFNYNEQMQELEQDIKENTDLEKAFKLDKELELLEEEANNELQSIFKESNIEPLPFEYKGDDRFSVQELRLTDAFHDGMRLEATINIDKEMKNKYGGGERHVFTYIRFYDQDNNPIDGWAVLGFSLPYKEEFKPGETYILKGSYNGLSRLTNFSKAVFHLRDEYEQNN
jgi:hypothetical protein